MFSCARMMYGLGTKYRDAAFATLLDQLTYFCSRFYTLIEFLGRLGNTLSIMQFPLNHFLLQNVAQESDELFIVTMLAF